MKRLTLKKTVKLVYLAMLSLLLPSCLGYNRIYEKKDYLSGSTIAEYTYHPRLKNRFESSSIQNVKQAIIRNQDKTGQLTFRVHDELTVNYKSVDDAKKIVYVIDQQPFLIKIDSIIISTRDQMNENRTNILGKDSSQISVVMGYSIQPSKTIHLLYTLPNETIQKIGKANDFFIYYQSSINITNFQPKRKHLRKIKKLAGM